MLHSYEHNISLILRFAKVMRKMCFFVWYKNQEFDGKIQKSLDQATSANEHCSSGNAPLYNPVQKA